LVKDGWYLSVKYYDRTPPTSTDSFVLDQKSEMVIDAEGVIFTGIAWLSSLLELCALGARQVRPL
jgi:hypothetical protein